ncbi:hypothetical protein OROGR_032385 [Orobanche gracilis]
MSPVFWGNVDLYYTKDVRCSHQVNKRLQIAVKIQKLISGLLEKRINRISEYASRIKLNVTKSLLQKSYVIQV